MTPDALGRIAAHELTAAMVMETPAAARRDGVRIDVLRDEPLLAALPQSHDYAIADAIPIRAFAAERVLLPREPPGQVPLEPTTQKASALADPGNDQGVPRVRRTSRRAILIRIDRKETRWTTTS